MSRVVPALTLNLPGTMDAGKGVPAPLLRLGCLGPRPGGSHLMLVSAMFPSFRDWGLVQPTSFLPRPLLPSSTLQEESPNS